MSPQQRPLPSATSGFTLIEMLVVVIIIGVLASIAAPDWFAYLMGRRVVTVRDELRQAMEEAQATAITRRETQTIYFYPDEDLPTIAVGGGSTPANSVTQEVVGSDGVRPGMIAISTSADSVAFDYRGTIISPTITESSPLVVEVVPGGGIGGRRSCIIVQTLLGNFRSEDGDACDL
ncbi:MAG: prepilin-type N-terminal cleavage/methylation domain-containing protein [Cyanobacteria bacterium]|nr:prepilin-type N-terminal cleavage/methylation domain-containing protein [Cyanobacteriota bacterium]